MGDTRAVIGLSYGTAEEAAEAVARYELSRGTLPPTAGGVPTVVPAGSPAKSVAAGQRARVEKRPRAAGVQVAELEEYKTKLAITLVESVLDARATA